MDPANKTHRMIWGPSGRPRDWPLMGPVVGFTGEGRRDREYPPCVREIGCVFQSTPMTEVSELRVHG